MPQEPDTNLAVPRGDWHVGETKTINVHNGTPGEKVTVTWVEPSGSGEGEMEITYDNNGIARGDLTVPDWDEITISAVDEDANRVITQS